VLLISPVRLLRDSCVSNSLLFFRNSTSFALRFGCCGLIDKTIESIIPLLRIRPRSIKAARLLAVILSIRWCWMAGKRQRCLCSWLPFEKRKSPRLISMDRAATRYIAWKASDLCAHVVPGF